MELTRLQELERLALTGDRDAIIELVSCVRLYRNAATMLLRERCTDGGVKSVDLRAFETRCAEIEECTK